MTFTELCSNIAIGRTAVTADIYRLFQTAWPAGVTMLVLGVGFAIVLLIARERLKVEIDPRVERIHKALPGIDCGACGFAGCAQYAKAVADNPRLLGRCAPGGQQVAEELAAILNLQISSSGPQKRPVVHCNAHTGDKAFFAQYAGLPSCTAANALPNAQACKFGCLGFGDCVRACKFDALHIIDGLASVDYDKCTGCGACVGTCPRDLIEMVPFRRENIMTVACRSRETSGATRSMCKVGCIGCGLCAGQSDLFSVEDNLARIDYERFEPTEQAGAAMDKCPTKVIIYVGKSG